MSINLGLLIVVGVLAACGAYLLTERSLVRMLLGLLLCATAWTLVQRHGEARPAPQRSVPVAPASAP